MCRSCSEPNELPGLVPKIFAKMPGQERYGKPHRESHEKRQTAVPDRNQFPDHIRKTHKPKASCGGATGSQRGRQVAALSFPYSGTLFLFSLMLFDQRGAGGENCWKGKEQPPEDRAVALGKESRDHGDRASKQEPHGQRRSLGPCKYLCAPLCRGSYCRDRRMQRWLQTRECESCPDACPRATGS